jgi:hypothetical protein
MISPNIPGPEETLAQLAPLIPPLYRSIEASVQEARSFFDDREERVDPFLFPCLVRYHAKLLLEEAGQTADYELDDLANNGLYLRFGGFQIRILKSDNGKLPVPGPSKPKQEFYSQQLEFDFMQSKSGQPACSLLNLVILWDLSSLRNLERLTLVCPKAGSTTRDSVEQHWEIQIPHPADSMKTEPGITIVEDLEISLKPQGRQQASKND